MSTPPPLPPDSIYTSCYCEENVYLLCQTFLQDPTIRLQRWEVFVVFLSNANKTVALWCQKGAKAVDFPVVWDYHVILVLRRLARAALGGGTELSEREGWVYDFDTCLPMPCLWTEYLGATFLHGVLPEYESKFRVVRGDLYLQYFASDRSHMLKLVARPSFGQESVESELSGEAQNTLKYKAHPPPYEPLRGPLAGITNNLMSHFVCMDGEDNLSGRYGEVNSRDGIESAFFTFPGAST